MSRYKIAHSQEAAPHACKDLAGGCCMGCSHSLQHLLSLLPLLPKASPTYVWTPHQAQTPHQHLRLQAWASLSCLQLPASPNNGTPKPAMLHAPMFSSSMVT